jgi:hypothetical protein
MASSAWKVRLAQCLSRNESRLDASQHHPAPLGGEGEVFFLTSPLVERFLGLDVHAETIAVAVAEPDGEVRSPGDDR